MIRGNRGGGAEEIRTPDLLLAKETLYQLSHGPRGDALFEEDPKRHGQHSGQESGSQRPRVGGSGLEPETSALSGQCSNQLS